MLRVRAPLRLRRPPVCVPVPQRSLPPVPPCSPLTPALMQGVDVHLALQRAGRRLLWRSHWLLALPPRQTLHAARSQPSSPAGPRARAARTCCPWRRHTRRRAGSASATRSARRSMSPPPARAILETPRRARSWKDPPRRREETGSCSGRCGPQEGQAPLPPRRPRPAPSPPVEGEREREGEGGRQRITERGEKEGGPRMGERPRERERAGARLRESPDALERVTGRT